ncbi:ribonuclease [Butyrivibrio fibrisolvens DSM 3071]|uniref:Ribonuclease n=1 Tax=Butyrivibrio fibrisolvens DSM 3071 TaxID=1121131 RepID=A0A1M6BMI1_BUTFI|nr:ribonuclease domain-containing protein [Butyrivibrio fibrisolvens]SHI49867.1 ribonuclease [Butyrivibrio fibrisolvens DSM 3071]
MKRTMKLIVSVLVLVVALTGCSLFKNGNPDNAELSKSIVFEVEMESGLVELDGDAASEGVSLKEVSDDGTSGDVDKTGEEENVTSADEIDALDEDGYYYDVESVVIYLETYDKLPSNFITKSEAKALGWEGGSVEDYKEGAAIGGDKFGNREGILPDNNYTECDIDTNGKDSRGACRLVFSDDGQYYYTEDHYESFTEIIVTDGEIEYGEVFGD